MHSPEILHDVLIFLAAAIVVVPLLLRFRIGLILGYLAAGVIIGPHALSLISTNSGAGMLAEFGIVFLLFMIGLELSVERLKALARNVFGLGSLQVIVSGILIGVVALLFGANGREAIIIGGGLALSSTAFVLQLLIKRGERANSYGQTAFAILLLQDLAVVPLLIIVRLLADTDTGLAQVAFLSAVQAAGAILAIIIIGRLVLRPLYRLIAGIGSSELFVATTLLVVLGTSWAVSLGGFSMALGAFMAGLLLAETEYRHQVEADIRPFRGILVGLFFIVIGMSIDLPLIAARWLDILLVVSALIIGKSLVTGLLCLAIGQNKETALRTGLLLSQGGEFGFVIFGAAMATNVLGHETGQILVAAISLSMAVTPLMHFLGSRLSPLIDRGPAPNLAAIGQETDDLDGHVIIVGFGRVGQTVAKALTLGGVDYVALDLHHGRVTRCHREGLSVFYGNGADIGILNAVGAGRASAAVVTTDQSASTDRAVKALRDSFPDLKIFVRARDLRHRQILTQEGATSVVPEALEASIQLAGIVLRAVGTSVETIDTVEQEFRRDDYLALEEIQGND
ncbi:MAG: monovalent cation:proton antiporter-2 (CPA2) family protein [Rhodospirillaceae bacterium]|nr:monovalent cation:proton antiporter-2 (CPA2) family protein [Rhodospirillaceae bacterium]